MIQLRCLTINAIITCVDKISLDYSTHTSFFFSR